MAVLRRRKDHGDRFELDYLDIDKRRYRVDTGTVDKKIVAAGQLPRQLVVIQSQPPPSTRTPRGGTKIRRLLAE
jgi:hypothetical protein